MKQLQKITTVALIVALTGLSPVVVADVAGGKERPANSQSDPVPPHKIALTAQQMDTVTAGDLSEPWRRSALYRALAYLLKDISGEVKKFHATCVANGGC